MMNDYLVSPITNTESMLYEDGLYLCFDSGYHRYDNWDVEEFKSKSPKEIVDSEFIDPDGNSWFKISMFSDNHILIPDSDGWSVNSWRDLELYPEVGYEFYRERTDSIHKWTEVLDPITARYFLTFDEAYNEFQKRVNND